MNRENKILFIGPMGAGKTTAITAISDAPPVSTEARNTHTHIANKATTTVALDYGCINLNDEQSLHLYGIPGQEHFRFTWPIVAKGALGAILLLDCSQPDWKAQMTLFLEAFDEQARSGSLVVALNRAQPPHIQQCFMALMSKQLVAPVFMADPRKRSDVLLMLEAIIANAEMEVFIDD